MQILSWQFIHLVLSVIFAVLILLIIKLNYFSMHKILRIVSLAVIGSLFVNSFGAFLVITIHYLSLGL